MKLFTKTLLFFISVIIFQSSLTTFLITNITKRSNLEDAIKELKNETTIVFDNYNSWKRGIWKALIEIQQDQQIVDILQNYRDAPFQKTLTGYLKDILLVSGIDIFVLKNSSHAETEIISITYNNFSLSELQELGNRKTHPYIEFRLLGNQLCMIGITRLELDDETDKRPFSYIDLFIIKRVDRDFCKQLILNRHSHVSFFLDNQYLSGTLDESAFIEIPGLTNFDTAGYDVHDIEMEKAGYNIAIQKLEKLPIAGGARQLFLVTVLSNSPYITRLTVLEKTVLYLTILSALLTIMLSLFLSRNITLPIKNLLLAMQRIRRGKYDTTIDEIQSHNEIDELFQGFNEMARKIRQDKERMENYIHEITVLKDYNEKIIHSIGAGIIIINENLDVEKINNSFLEHFNLDEQYVLGRNVRHLNLDVIDDAIVENVQAILRRDKEEYSKVKRAKKNKVYEMKLYPINSPDEDGVNTRETVGCVLVVEDISRKIEFEEKIFQAEKLSSISMLSAGVAHEINNPLSSIMTNVQNLIEEEEDREKSVSLRWIEQETRRIAKIVQKLLDFSSSDLDSIQGTDVNRLITETITLIKYSLKKTQDIAITTNLEEDIPYAGMSQDEFKQIIINLVKNSIQAIEVRGNILIKTRGGQDGTICVTIEDDGIGIREEIIPHIFDPFYTTKHNGEGTGLGLSVVYGIINKYRGTITVTSKEGKGTRISLAIPLLENR